MIPKKTIPGDRITIDGVSYVREDFVSQRREGDRLIFGIVDSGGLSFVGYTNFKPDETGMIPLREAQCVLRWWTGAHFNHLIHGVCTGVSLGAKADIRVKEFVVVVELPFETMEEWKATVVLGGNPEVFCDRV
jgi:hypothetical protein